MEGDDMNPFRKCFPGGISLANAILAAVGLTGCSAPVGDATAQSGSELSAPATQPANLLAGPWQYVASASCGQNPFGTVNGDEIAFGSGYYCSEGDGQPFLGFTFEQPVAVVAGGTYELTLDLSNFNGWLGFIPSQFTATIAGVSQTAQATSSTSLLQMTFALGALPPGTPTVTFNFRPPAGGIGPVNGGIFLTEEGCDVSVSLVQTN
jgi:hypothetical protein